MSGKIRGADTRILWTGSPFLPFRRPPSPESSFHFYPPSSLPSYPLYVQRLLRFRSRQAWLRIRGTAKRMEEKHEWCSSLWNPGQPDSQPDRSGNEWLGTFVSYSLMNAAFINPPLGLNEDGRVARTTCWVTPHNYAIWRLHSVQGLIKSFEMRIISLPKTELHSLKLYSSTSIQRFIAHCLYSFVKIRFLETACTCLKLYVCALEVRM